MKNYTYLIVGGGLSAARAAEGIRERDRKGSVLMVTEEALLPYDRPPLSKQGLCEGAVAKELELHSRWYYLTRRIRMKRRSAVTALEPDAKPRTARLSDGTVVGFEKAVLATGARARRLPVPGADLAGVQTLRHFEDAYAIQRELTADGGASGKRVVIVGAGFIGLEAAAALTRLGAAVTVVELREHVWPGIAPAPLASFLTAYLESVGVQFLFGNEVSAVEGGSRAERVVLSDGEHVNADMVLAAVGIEPAVELAERAGIGVEREVLVDDQLQTSAAGIWAAGDVVKLKDPTNGRVRRLEHYGSAEATGYLAGLNAAGAGRTFQMLPYVWSDIGPLRIDIAGDETGWEETVIRGSLDAAQGPDAQFAVLGLSGGKMVCYFAANMPDAERSALQLLIRQRTNLTDAKEALQDTGRPLQQVVMELIKNA